jgi:hypothetical protein
MDSASTRALSSVAGDESGHEQGARVYTLLVTGGAAEQDRGVFPMDASRFLEFTDEAIVAELKSLSAEAVALLQAWPCILMDEGRGGEKVRVGRTTHASRVGRNIKLTFEPLGLRTA